MRTTLLSILILATACTGSIGQTSQHIRSPQPNEEICLKETLPISATYTNHDSVTRTLVARFVITNIVTNRIVYDTCDTLRNMSPGATIDTTFPSYVTNPNFLTQLGTFLACTKISALDALGSPITDWPFADSSCVRIFGIRTMSLPFNDPNNDYSITATGAIPDQRKWVSLGTTVNDGEYTTWDPPPPRYEPNDTGGFGAYALRAPLLQFDRLDSYGKPYSGLDVGDTLNSFPFNLKGQTRAILTFDFMRGGSNQYTGLWDAKKMLGPEHTIVNNTGSTLRTGDSLIIEFKEPTEPKCNPAKWNRIAAIGGSIDFEFKSFWLQIRDSISGTLRISNSPTITFPIDRKYCDTAFRFRLRFKANYDGDISTKDDNDPWYIDNVGFNVPRHPEIGIRWVRVVTPYTKIPYAAAAALPVYINILDPSTPMSGTAPFKVHILNEKEDTVYSQTMQLALAEGRDTTIRFPDWNAQAAVGSSKFTVYAKIGVNGYGYYSDDDQTYSTFYLNVDQGSNAVQEFALDDAGMSPSPGIGNDVPLLTGQVSQGIGFDRTSGSYAIKFTLPQPDTLFGTRVFFTNLNSSLDPIRISVLRGDSGSCIPGDTIATFMDIRKLPMNFFSTHLFPNPVSLPAGIYWVSVSQLSIDNYMIGGDMSRGGAQITIADSLSPMIPPIYSSPYGTQISPWENTGDIRCMYAVEVPAGSGQWLPWMPTSGWWPTSSLGNANQQITFDPNMSAPYNRAGTYLPMIRPMVGSFGGGQSHVTDKHQNDFTFEQPHPNPFTPRTGPTELHFNLTKSGTTSLIIYDAIGREVRTLIDATLEKGEHTLRWDGRDATGNYVASGPYLYRLTSGDHIASLRILVIQ